MVNEVYCREFLLDSARLFLRETENSCQFSVKIAFMLISTTVHAVELCLLSECLEGQDQCQEPDNINCGDNLCPTLINNLYKDKGIKYYI